MSGTGSDYNPADQSDESSFQEERSRKSSRAPSVASRSSRKRRRSGSSSSLDSIPDVRYELQGHYKDEYRTLYNTEVNDAAIRFKSDASFHPSKAQIGVSTWSSEEKSTFFAALERLGRDDIPGIAAAVRSKTIPEVRYFLLLLRDVSAQQGTVKVTLQDVPPAAEISAECSERLDLAGEALAWYQERFEAKKEQERFGNYWLITPEIAEDIETAMIPSRMPSLASSEPPGVENEEDTGAVEVPPPIPQILQDIPEASMINTSNLLELSKEVFMNGSPNPPSWYPHWTTLRSPLASKPSIYRTALIDFHTLVLSLTKRLVQASIIQANSRIRTQGWRVKKGVTSLVKKRDALTAIDMLQLPRNPRERWRCVARRCGLRVFRGSGNNKREMRWNEVEEALEALPTVSEETTPVGDSPGPVSGAEDSTFKARAMRSGTPLPSQRIGSALSDHSEGEASVHKLDDVVSEDGSSVSSLVSSVGGPARSPSPTEESEYDALEAIDAGIAQAEESRLWNVLNGTSPATAAEIVKVEEAEDTKMPQPGPGVTEDDNWRTYIEYRAEWEEFDEPVPLPIFENNRKSLSPAPLPTVEQDFETVLSSDAESPRNRRLRKRRKVIETEMPIRGARTYAALQDPDTAFGGRQLEDDRSADEAEWPAPSIEGGDASLSRARSISTDDMDMD